MKFIEDLHVIESLLLRMPNVDHDERTIVIRILEFAITVETTYYPPLPELSALKKLLQDAVTTSSTFPINVNGDHRDLILLILSTIKKIILNKTKLQTSISSSWCC